MTKIYCLKCKAYTETENEDQDISTNGRHRLSGGCIKCGKVKCVFTNANYDFDTQKSARERAKARIQRKERTLNRKAKKLGREIYDSENKKIILKHVRRDLEA